MNEMNLIKKPPKWCWKCHYKAKIYNKRKWTCDRCGAENISLPLFQWIHSLFQRHPEWCPQCFILMKKEIIARDWDFKVYEYTCPQCNAKEEHRYSIFFS